MTTPSQISRNRHPALATVVEALLGFGILFCIAVLATTIQRASGISALSPLIVAIGLGIGFRTFIGRPAAAQPGIALTMKPMLRMAIVLLGFQITVTEIAAIGPKGLVAVIGTLVATLIFTKLMARVLGVEQRLAELIAVGTSVCGASAIVACNTVTRGSDEDVAYALACVTLFGTGLMLGLPFLAEPLGLAPETYGIWAGTTIHEVAQVVGAAFAQGETAGHAGTVAKLSRVICLAPLILVLGMMRNRTGEPGAKAPTPWFVYGFIAAMALNSMIGLPTALIDAFSSVTAFMLTLALAAMGIETDLRKLRLMGGRAFALGAMATLFITVTGLQFVLWAVG